VRSVRLDEKEKFTRQKRGPRLVRRFEINHYQKNTGLNFGKHEKRKEKAE